MRVFKALSIEGAPDFGVLCYAIFPIHELDAAYCALMSIERDSESRVYKLFDDQWPNGIILNEVTVKTEEAVLSAVSSAFFRMFDSGPCLSAVCMYDGAFGDYDDIFSSELSNQTYAFCFYRNQQVINLDENALSSKEWRSIVTLCRNRLRSASIEK